MLDVPATAPLVGKDRFPAVDTSMQTQVTPPEAGLISRTDVERRGTPAPNLDDPHSLPTVADAAAPTAAELERMAIRAETPTESDVVSHADLIEETATETLPTGVGAAVEPTHTSPFSDRLPEDSGDPVDESGVFTKTVADEAAVTIAAGGLPPLPQARTPAPVAPAAERAAGAPPRPNTSSEAPTVQSSAAPRATTPSKAPPMPPSMSKKASRSGVLSSAPAPDTGTMSASGRPSDILPRPPAAAVLHPGPAMPPQGAAAPMMQSIPTPSGMHGPAPLASPAPPEMMSPGSPGSMAAPAPPGMQPGGVPPMMQSHPTPSNMARPMVPGSLAGPAQPPLSGDAAMPSAYALPGTGYPPAAPAAAPVPGHPLVHTPIPPGLIGPPPDLNDGPDLGAALDSLGEQSFREHTPAGDAVWREAHPSAQRWAAKRQGGSVRTPKPGIIALGLMLAGLGAYLLAIFLPSKQPLTAAKIDEISRQAGVDENAWRFSEQLFDAANINAALFVLLGVVIVLRGAMFRQQPAGQVRKGLGKPALLLIFCFALLAVSFAALLLKAST